MSDDPELERAEAVMCKLGEQFQDYLMIVRTNHGKIAWKSRDATWALGAIERYRNSMLELDRIDDRHREEE